MMVSFYESNWEKIYGNEENLIQALKSVDVVHYERSLYNGYVFIRSFQRRINNGLSLTQKQMIQLKRLASEIHKYQINEQGKMWII